MRKKGRVGERDTALFKTCSPDEHEKFPSRRAITIISRDELLSGAPGRISTDVP